MSKIELLNVDCLEYMRGLPDKAFDLAIVDPPYGMVGNTFTCKTRKFANEGETKSVLDCDSKRGISLGVRPDKQYFDELERVAVNSIVWGMQYFVPNLKPHACTIVWDKCNGGNRFSDAELAYTTFDTAVRIYRGWNEPRGDNLLGRIHPTQKPVPLYRWLLKNYAKPGQRILDTHGGSMSIAIACDIEGYDLTLCEIDKDYFEAGKKRLEQHRSQPRLFEPEAKPTGEQLTIDPAV